MWDSQTKLSSELDQKIVASFEDFSYLQIGLHVDLRLGVVAPKLLSFIETTRNMLLHSSEVVRLHLCLVSLRARSLITMDDLLDLILLTNLLMSLTQISFLIFI